MVRVAAPETATVIAPAPTVATVTVPVAKKAVALGFVIRPNRILGASRAAPEPIIASVEESLAPGLSNDVEKIPTVALKNEAEEASLVSPAVGARPLLNSSVTSAATSFRAKSGRIRTKRGMGCLRIRSCTVTMAEGAVIVSARIFAVCGIPMLFAFL